MSLLGRIRQLVRSDRDDSASPRSSVREWPEGGASKPPTPERRAAAKAWCEALEAGLLNPPADMHSREAWDEYWRNQQKFDMGLGGFSDFMDSNPDLPRFLAERGVRTILCAGNGLSSEAASFTFLGFDVTALDISAIPEERFAVRLPSQGLPPSEPLGAVARDNGSIWFSALGPINPELCPPMHRNKDTPGKGGGSLRHVTGDLTDPAVCPGPFDAVIERRSVQLFRGAEQGVALERLAARLGPRGVLVSGQHNGGWRPGTPRVHFAQDWAQSHGFAIKRWKSADPAELHTLPRVACLFYTSG